MNILQALKRAAHSKPKKKKKKRKAAKRKAKRRTKKRRTKRSKKRKSAKKKSGAKKRKHKSRQAPAGHDPHLWARADRVTVGRPDLTAQVYQNLGGKVHK